MSDTILPPVEEQIGPPPAMEDFSDSDDFPEGEDYPEQNPVPDDSIFEES